jgi:hypothetical protein
MSADNSQVYTNAVQSSITGGTSIVVYVSLLIALVAVGLGIYLFLQVSSLQSDVATLTTKETADAAAITTLQASYRINKSTYQVEGADDSGTISYTLNPTTDGIIWFSCFSGSGANILYIPAASACLGYQFVIYTGNYTTQTNIMLTGTTAILYSVLNSKSAFLMSDGTNWYFVNSS